MRALCRLEASYARHQIAAIARSPLRLSAWILYAAAIGGVTALRSLQIPHEPAVNRLTLAPDRATAAAGLYLALLGGMALGAAFGRIAPFRNAAEPVLFSNAGLRPLTIAVWLQARKTVTGWLRSFATLIYLLLLFSPQQTNAVTTVVTFTALILLFAITISIELPVFLLARGQWRSPVRGIAVAVTALGLTYGIAGMLGDAAPLARLTHADPGRAAALLLTGHAIALIVPLAVFVFLIAIVVTLGDDALPELYAVSQRTPTSPQDGDVALARTLPQRHRANRRVPRGAFALVWKDWITFCRRSGAFAFSLLSCTFSAACGAGAALVSQRAHDPTPLLLLGGALGLFVVFIAPSGANAGLAADLDKPLFWLSPVALRLRLAAWAFGRGARLGFALALAPLCVAAVFGDTIFAMISLPAGIVGGWALQALGVALYSLFPNPFDARGPIAALRTVLTVAYFIPGALVAAIVAVLHGRFAELGIAFAATLAAEGWLAVEFAAVRLRAGGTAIATASR